MPPAPPAGRGVRAFVQPLAELTESHRSARTNPWQVLGQIFIALPIPVWLALDALLIWAATVKSYHWINIADQGHHVQAWLGFTICAGSTMVFSLVLGLNERTTLRSGWRVLTRMVLVTTLSAALVYAIIYVLLYYQLSRRITLAILLSYFVVGTAIRLTAACAIRTVRRRILVVGRAEACTAFAGRLRDGLLDTHEIVGYTSDEPDTPATATLPRLGSVTDIVRLCRELRVRDIVVCNGIAHSPDAMHWILPALRLGCRVTNEATFYETSAGQILVDELTPDWFLFTDLRAHCAEYALVKRLFDVVVSIVGLLVSLPLYPLIALAIKLDDGGPVFYAQNRVGRNGRVFRLYKFRTMRPDAESGESRWATPNDPRVTRVGRLLRRTRCDEWPQFWNILRGDMAVVGPRPERPDLVETLCRVIPFWCERNLVKPGLTGWAQISFRYGSTLEDAKRKLQFDFYYLKHMSLELDTIILFRTLGTFLRGAC